MALFQAFPERNQGIGPLAPADEDHRSALQIQHHGEVAVAVADGDFVDGQPPKMLQFGLAEASDQVAFQEMLDGIPADPQVFGYGLDGRVGEESQGIVLKGRGEAALRLSEGDAGLPDDAAVAATQSGHRQVEVDRLATHRQGAEGAFDGSVTDHIGRPAGGTAVDGGRLFEVEGQSVVATGGAENLVVADTKGLIQ